MKTSTTIALGFLSTLAAARENIFNFNALLTKREVPQEHSHEKFLRSCQQALILNNPDKIQDAVFGLLGNAAASTGKGNIADPDCLQQATADRAFTNAKAAGNIELMTAALVYRALERNTGRVGLASVLCTSIKAVNPEIAALTQHQDPASANAATINKGITLALAKQIKSVGGDPLVAIQSGTFAPGDVNDATGKGNSCDDLDDPTGCIFTKNLLVPDASEAEVLAAAGGAGTGSAPPAASSAVVTAAPAAPTKVAAPPAATTLATSKKHRHAKPSKTTAAAPAATQKSNNVQSFTGALGAPPVAVDNVGGARPFVVNGNSFVNFSAACQRACDIQHNKCADAANASGNKGTLTVGACGTQQAACGSSCSS